LQQTSATGLEAAATVPASEKVGIIDIGSNSLRLVVFEGLKRAPAPVFNEKVLCGLGRGIDKTGRLNEEGIASALPSLIRFVRLADAMNVKSLDLLATAALREAEDGPDFIRSIKERSGREIRVLSGEEEARFAALGVLAADPCADGIIGDLGGGSLELVEICDGHIGRYETLPLGPLRMTGFGRSALTKEIRRQLESVDWLTEGRGRKFYPVGGAWRNLARIHMDQANYPLHVVHGYSLRRREAQSFAKVVSKLSSRSMSRIKQVSRRRRETLPHASLVLDPLLEIMGPKRVIFSTFGLREGFLFDQLSEEEQAHDPLIAMATEIAVREGRFGDLGDTLMDWTEPLFSEEPEEARRLRCAASHLSDIAWREHPDYRAIQALRKILHFPLVGVDHRARIFLAFAVFVRYGGRLETSEVTDLAGLLSEEEIQTATILGQAFRLAYRVSGATIEVLQRTKLERKSDRLKLILPADGSVLSGETVEKSLQALIEAAGLGRGDVVI